MLSNTMDSIDFGILCKGMGQPPLSSEYCKIQWILSTLLSSARVWSSAQQIQSAVSTTDSIAFSRLRKGVEQLPAAAECYQIR